MPDPDRTLLRGIERGETAALEALARHYAAPVYRYLVRLCGDVTLAEDLAQEVAIQMWRALPGRRFPNGKALNAWVYTVAANAFYMHRRRKRASEVSWDEEVELPAGEECDPALATERQDLARRVRHAVDALPEPERQALLLKAFADLRYQDIAEATGEPVGTVKWRISRAYARLRRILLPEMHPAEEGHEDLRSTAAVPGRRDEPAAAMAHGASPAPVSRLFGTKGR
jgi:RNA polymerase sigma-70 factor, ECF subfamily